MIDWLGLRRTLVSLARRQGWGVDSEDRAQEALVRTFGARPAPRDPEAYAVACLRNLGAPELMCDIVDAELVGVEPTQHEMAERAEQRFLLRVAVTLSALERSSQHGGAARIARHRVRRAVEALVGTGLVGGVARALPVGVGTGLAGAPPPFKAGVGPSGAGSPHAGRGRGKKPTVVAESERG